MPKVTQLENIEEKLASEQSPYKAHRYMNIFCYTNIFKL